MTEDDARSWFRARWPEQETAVSTFIQMLRSENLKQNLISATTVDQVWARHVVDSAQLAELAPPANAPWIDVGTGGGFPGLICALVRPEPAILVEPRRRRADFLHEVAVALRIDQRVDVQCARIESVSIVAGTISARAVGPISRLLDQCIGCIGPSTALVLPRGRVDHDDVAHARHTWNMTFHVEPSLTDPNSEIAVLSGVSRA